jgi:hypothetical protein
MSATRLGGLRRFVMALAAMPANVNVQPDTLSQRYISWLRKIKRRQRRIWATPKAMALVALGGAPPMIPGTQGV